MAKLNFSFQDEIGTNLNRFSATNVSTGEKIVFDLLRNANITQKGSVLNADTLNRLIEAINGAYKIEIDTGTGKPSDELTIGGIFLEKL